MTYIISTLLTHSTENVKSALNNTVDNCVKIAKYNQSCSALKAVNLQFDQVSRVKLTFYVASSA